MAEISRITLPNGITYNLKAAVKPTYTASEVGAMSSDVVIAVGGTVTISGTSASFDLNSTIYQMYIAAKDGKSVQIWDKNNNRLYELVDMDYDEGNVKFTFINMTSNTIRIITTGFYDTFGASKTFSGTYSTIDLSTFSGSYDDLTNKPTNVSTFTNDAGYITQSQIVFATQSEIELALNVAGFGSPIIEDYENAGVF